MFAKKYYIQNSSTRTSENGKYLDSVIGGSVITLVEVIGPIKTMPITFNDKKPTCKMYNFYISLALVLVAIFTIEYRQYLHQSNKNIYQHAMTPAIN